MSDALADPTTSHPTAEAEEGVDLSAAAHGNRSAEAEPDPPLGSPWSDLRAYVALPRLGGLVVSPEGTLLVSVSELDHDKTRYRSAWWWVDPEGRRPARRWTRSTEGESNAGFLPDGSLLFTSKRPVPPAGEEEGKSEEVGVVWCLPSGGGEAYVVARRDGGWQSISTARTRPTAVLTAAVHPGAADETADAEQRALRKKLKVSAILHEGYPVRCWDHDLGPEQPRAFAVDLSARRAATDASTNADANTDADAGAGADYQPAREDFRRLVPTDPTPLESAVVTPDGSAAALSVRRAARRGDNVDQIVLVDLASGDDRPVAPAADDLASPDSFTTPVVDARATTLACVREAESTPETPPDQTLWLVDLATGEGRPLAGDWDAWPFPVGFSPDAQTLYVTVDEAGHHPVYAVSVATGERRRLTGDGAYSPVVVADDGAVLYAVRSSYTDPGTVVAINPADGTVRELRSPADYPELPGRTVEVHAAADDGVDVHGLLILPEGASAETPAPLALWIHGGPLGSWNSWSWRWCPWLLASQGWAVLLPDPALSTGYGLDFVRRGWGQWGGRPYTDLMAVTDAVVERPDIDSDVTVAMGGSFGGYMANWVAGHTDRFRAIVSHASLWNLESFGPTTDASWYWAKEMTPQMQVEHSPHRAAGNIRTPMLVIHGDKDYRVPISEGLALWWSLVSRFDGDPAELPHRFLYFPDENHWVLSPQHSILWYETVRSFVDAHARGGNFVRPRAL